MDLLQNGGFLTEFFAIVHMDFDIPVCAFLYQPGKIDAALRCRIVKRLIFRIAEDVSWRFCLRMQAADQGDRKDSRGKKQGAPDALHEDSPPFVFREFARYSVGVQPVRRRNALVKYERF